MLQIVCRQMTAVLCICNITSLDHFNTCTLVVNKREVNRLDNFYNCVLPAATCYSHINNIPPLTHHLFPILLLDGYQSLQADLI